MAFVYIKAIHIIFIVTWFAGLFYIVRLFIYNTEANVMEEPARSILQNQYLLMQTRLWYGITWPSAILTAILGGSLAWHYTFVPLWLWVKLSFIVLLYAYHFLCHHIYVRQQKLVFEQSAFQLRIWNEVATILLVSIVFLVVVKSMLSWLWSMVGLIIFSALIMLSIMIYKKIRERTPF